MRFFGKNSKRKTSNKKTWPIIVVILLVVLAVLLSFRKVRFEGMIAFYKARSLYGALAWQNRYPIDYPYDRIDDLLPENLTKPIHHICYYRQLSGDNQFQQVDMKQHVAALLHYCQQHLSPQTAQPLPLLQLPDDEALVRFYVQQRFPFVIRNKQGWQTSKPNGTTIHSLFEKYGDTHVMFDQNNETFEGKLRDMLQHKAYLSNSTSFMKKNPHIVHSDDIAYLIKVSGLTPTISQIFMSLVPNNGTPMHAAFSHNFFFMVEGQKRWTFFHPDYLALTYPYFPKNGIYFASYSALRDFGDTDALHKYPLLQYAPHYEVVLQEGDVLFNPGPWWHAIRNVTEQSLAFATRWVYPEELVPSPNQLQYCQITNPNVDTVFREVYSNTGSFQFDVDENYSGDVKEDTIALIERMNHDALEHIKNEQRHLEWH